MQLCLWEAAPAPLAPSLYSCWFMDANTRGLPGCASREKVVGLHTVLGCSQGCPHVSAWNTLPQSCHPESSWHFCGHRWARPKLGHAPNANIRVWDTRELAPSPARYLGTRGVWKGRLSLREQLCTGFQKKTVGKSCDSLLIFIALRYTYVVYKHQLDLLGKIPKSGNWSLKNQPGHWNVAFLPQMK